jgi:cbb3-type cytochrome oxidase maturation protein
VSAIYIMLPVSLLLAGFFLVAYIWSVRSGQFEDTETPALRILPEDKTISARQSSIDSQKPNTPT